MKTLLTAILPLALVVPALPAQETLAIKTGTLIISPTKTYDKGVLLVRSGKVVDCGVDLPLPAATRVIDLTGAVVAPGFIDAWSQVGARGEGQDNARPFTPTMRIADAVDLRDRKWTLYPALGFTSVVLAPDTSQVAGGLSCLVKTGRRPRVVESSLSLQLSLVGEARVRERPPTSLPGQVTLIRDRFGALAQMGEKAEKATCPATRIMAKVLAGKLALGIRCRTPHEVVAAAGLTGMTGPAPFLVGALQHRRSPEILSRAGTGAVLLPVNKEAPAWQLRLPGKLAAAGVTVAFGSGQPQGAMISLRARAARAINYGMTRADAHGALTLAPARLLGISHMIGTLAKGRDADFIVLDGHPLNPASRITRTYIEGRQVFDAAAHMKEAGK